MRLIESPVGRATLVLIGIGGVAGPLVPWPKMGAVDMKSIDLCQKIIRSPARVLTAASGLNDCISLHMAATLLRSWLVNGQATTPAASTASTIQMRPFRLGILQTNNTASATTISRAVLLEPL